MIRPEVYAEWAAGFGCTIGVASNVGPLVGTVDRVDRAILMAIDLGCYQWMQRQLATRGWGRKSLSLRYETLIKEWRNAKAKSAKIQP
jgi:hypothetical protein